MLSYNAFKNSFKYKNIGKNILNILTQYLFNCKVNEILRFLRLTVRQFSRSRQIFKISAHFGFFSNETDGRIVVKTDSERPYLAMCEGDGGCGIFTKGRNMVCSWPRNNVLRRRIRFRITKKAADLPKQTLGRRCCQFGGVGPMAAFQ